MRALLFILFLTGCCPLITAQVNTATNSGTALLVGLSYGFHIPAGDLQERFGINFSPALQLDLLMDKKNWIFSLQGSLQFGSTVKTDVLAGLRTAEGYIIATDRAVADIQLRERGFYLGASIGKLISLSNGNYRSGLRLDLGAGLLQHQIRIQDDPVRTVAQLTGEYRKGYDRLTNGAALREFIGYQILSKDRRVNFYGGLELIQAFTQNRRSYDFPTQEADQQQRLDVLSGFRLGIILPFYINQDPGQIYY